MYIATKILLTYLSLTAPDLCDVVNKETGTPTICMPHAEGAPVYNADVCCSGSNCVAPTRGTCATGRTRFYCELGEINAAGTVSCYWEVPYYCDVFACDDALEIGIGPQHGGSLCCDEESGICEVLVPEQGNCPPENILYCNSIVTNEDGTVECLDE